MDELITLNIPFSLLFIDLNRFKPANDAHGHEVGDLILQAVAMQLTKIARKDDQVARWGGDKFIIIQVADDIEDSAEHFAQRIYQAFEERFIIRNINIDLGASIGYDRYPMHAANQSELIKRTDIAMYYSKTIS